MKAKVSKTALAEARKQATTAQEIFEVGSRIEWANANNGAVCPPEWILTPEAVAAGLPQTKKTEQNEAQEHFERAIILAPPAFWTGYVGSIPEALRWMVGAIKAMYRDDRPAPPPEDETSFHLHAIASRMTVEQWAAHPEFVQALWHAAEEARPQVLKEAEANGEREIAEALNDHKTLAFLEELKQPLKQPFAPLIRGLQTRPRDMKSATVTAAASMTRKPELLSQIESAAWIAVVDGEPMVARLDDANSLFPAGKVKRIRKRGLFRPGESQGVLNIPGIRAPPRDWRLAVLEGLPSILAGDALTLLTLAHQLDRLTQIDEMTGAALLARTRDGGFRRPLRSDIDRFWQAAYWLASAALFDPNGSWRWASLATVQADGAHVIIGPPAWRRDALASRYTLTAEGGQAARARIVAGEQGNAGRMVTGLEYRLAATFDPRAGNSPLLLPSRGKSGPGHSLFVPYRETLWLMGDEWDATDVKAENAARKRFNRAYEQLNKAGYVRARGEAEAGDVVEIVGRVRGSKARSAGLMVRATARFVEAARKAQLKDGRGFEVVSLREWLGLK